MFDRQGDSGEEEVDDDDDLPQQVFVSSRGSNRSKSSRVGIVCIFNDVLIIVFSQSGRNLKRDAELDAEVSQLHLLNLPEPHHH